jgi:hypothetical protein
METYKQQLKCTNCGQEVEVDIPKGVVIDIFIIGKNCKNCGCAALQRGYNNTRTRYDEKENAKYTKNMGSGNVGM